MCHIKLSHGCHICQLISTGIDKTTDTNCVLTKHWKQRKRNETFQSFTQEHGGQCIELFLLFFSVTEKLPRSRLVFKSSVQAVKCAMSASPGDVFNSGSKITSVNWPSQPTCKAVWRCYTLTLRKIAI